MTHTTYLLTQNLSYFLNILGYWHLLLLSVVWRFSWLSMALCRWLSFLTTLTNVLLKLFRGLHVLFSIWIIVWKICLSKTRTNSYLVLCRWRKRFHGLKFTCACKSTTCLSWCHLYILSRFLWFYQLSRRLICLISVIQSLFDSQSTLWSHCNRFLRTTCF